MSSVDDGPEAPEGDHWMAMFTRTFNFDDINPQDISIDDIARGLGAQPRYLGQTTSPYSVAQHSVAASVLAEERGYAQHIQFIVLMHDAAEAYCGDLPHPLKRMLPQYNRVIEHVELEVASKFNYQYPYPAAVKRIDQDVYAYERRGISSHSAVDTSDIDPPPKGTMKVLSECWDFRRARSEFVCRYADYRSMPDNLSFCLH